MARPLSQVLSSFSHTDQLAAAQKEQPQRLTSQPVMHPTIFHNEKVSPCTSPGAVSSDLQRPFCEQSMTLTNPLCQSLNFCIFFPAFRIGSPRRSVPLHSRD